MLEACWSVAVQWYRPRICPIHATRCWSSVWIESQVRILEGPTEWSGFCTDRGSDPYHVRQVWRNRRLHSGWGQPSRPWNVFLREKKRKSRVLRCVWHLMRVGNERSLFFFPPLSPVLSVEVEAKLLNWQRCRCVAAFSSISWPVAVEQKVSCRSCWKHSPRGSLG